MINNVGGMIMNNDQSNDEIGINFNPEYANLDFVEETASKYIEVFSKMDMNDIMRKRFSGKTGDEVGIIPIFVKFPVVVHPKDIITGDSALYRHIVELYATDIFGDPEHGVLNITISKEVAGKVIDFHNKWVNVTYNYGGGDACIMFISVRKKDYKLIDAWECHLVVPRPETISEKDIDDNGLILKFSALFLQNKDIDRIAKEYLTYAKDLNERIDLIGTV